MKASLEAPRVLEELSWSEQQLPQKERTRHVHGIHPYLGKYVPQLVQYLLWKYFRNADSSGFVLDPFSGSGTTLVECSIAARPSLGLDVSEFNVLLSRVKTSLYDLAELGREVSSIVYRTKSQVHAMARDVLDAYMAETAVTGMPRETSPGYLRSWYHPNALLPLLVFRDLLPEYENQDFLRVLLSRTARSARLAPHFELDFPRKPQTEDYECYKHHRTCHPTTSSLQFLTRYARDMLSRVAQFQEIRSNAQLDAFCQDAQDFDYFRYELSGVITSPPYVGLIDYHEQHRYAYELLGLTDRSGEEIGRRSDGSSKAAIERYSASVASVLRRIADRGLVDPGLIIIVVNDKFNLYDDIVEISSLRIVDRYRRRVDRRTGRRAGGFYEDILVLSA